MQPISRRSFMTKSALAGSALALGGVLDACGSSGAGGGGSGSGSAPKNSAFAKANIEWKRFAGTTITFAASANPWVTAIQPELPSFTQLTGIKINVQTLGENEFVTKLPLTLTSGSGSPQVFMVNQPGQAVAAHWVAPLDPFQSNSKLTDSSWYDYRDVFKGARDFATSGGTQWFMPISAEVQVLYARKDLVPNAPKTISDLIAQAHKANSSSIAGIGMRASADPSETPWPYGGFVFTEGGYFIDPSGHPALDSAAAVRALTAYSELLRSSGPKGVTSWGWLQAEQAFEQGQIAMWSDSTSFASTLLDPSTARDAKKTVIYPMPTVHGAAKPNVWYWTLGINKKASTKDQQAAWLFLQWATSKPLYAATAAQTGTAIRGSSWASPSVSSKLGAAAATAIHDALAAADSRPMSLAWNNPKWSQIASYVAQGVSATVAGSSSVKSAASTMQSKASAIA